MRWLVMAAVWFAVACGGNRPEPNPASSTAGPDTASADVAAAEPAVAEPAAPEPAAPEPTPPTELAANPDELPTIGVPECDAWAASMVACMNNPQFPQAALEPTRKAFREVVDQWVAMPEEAKPRLAQPCLAATEAAAKAYAPMGCVF